MDGIEQRVRNILSEQYNEFFAVVVSVNQGGTANIKLLYADSNGDEYGILHNVPVVQAGSQAFSLSVPLSTGDIVRCITVRKGKQQRSGKVVRVTSTTSQHNLIDTIILGAYIQYSEIKEGELSLTYKGQKITLTDSQISLQGNVKIEGDLEVSGKTEVDGDIVAGEVLVGDIPLSTHGHKIPSGGDSTGKIPPNPPP